MQTFSTLIRYFFLALLMPPFYLTALVVGVFHRGYAWRIIARWNGLLLRLFDVKVRVEYEHGTNFKNGGVIVGLNQESVLETTIGIVASPKYFRGIWNFEYALIPFAGWIAFIFGWVIIRQRPNQALKQLEKAKNYIQKGGLVYLSIEGKRSPDGTLSPYKKGPVVLAIDAQADIHPIIVEGAGQCLGYGEWKIKPGTVTFKVLKPVSTKGLTYDDRDLLVQQLREMALKHRQQTATNAQGN
ncbi:lysophospholipid acyltransferase family protein [Algicola sagamiensis]|uniref:lysophospholipid acyltransferase family protein n=1 Tax=Algicola sagamiensis TaxID=163869 RepID=UPI00058C3D51|nr:lysophospholipid acyltransferase family protein [Algicola sagamiensis]